MSTTTIVVITVGIWLLGIFTMLYVMRKAKPMTKEPATLVEVPTDNVYHRSPDGLYRLHYKGSNYPPGYKYHYLMSLGTFKHK